MHAASFEPHGTMRLIRSIPCICGCTFGLNKLHVHKFKDLIICQMIISCVFCLYSALVKGNDEAGHSMDLIRLR